MSRRRERVSRRRERRRSEDPRKWRFHVIINKQPGRIGAPGRKGRRQTWGRTEYQRHYCRNAPLPRFIAIDTGFSLAA